MRHIMINRRLFIGGAGALAGAAVGGLAHAQSRIAAPISRSDWDAMIARNLGSERFTCVGTADYTEGPFYYETSPRRRDVTEGRPGEKLKLKLKVGGLREPGACSPLAGAVVDIWHSDATGLYSNIGPDIQYADTSGETFMRGHQLTDDQGMVEFDTIVPGWEIISAPPPVNVAMRTTHIHVKIFHARHVLTTQLFLPDGLLDGLYAATEPYMSHRVLRAPGHDRLFERIRNPADGLFAEYDATPMDIAWEGGMLVGRATIGMISPGNLGIEPLFR